MCLSGEKTEDCRVLNGFSDEKAWLRHGPPKDNSTLSSSERSPKNDWEIYEWKTG
jgi:hypothetical protein